MPFSIEYCNAPIAVMTEITEKTPMVIPSIVSAERSLFVPRDDHAILMISLNIIPILLVPERCYGIEARRCPSRRES